MSQTIVIDDPRQRLWATLDDARVAAFYAKGNYLPEISGDTALMFYRDYGATVFCVEQAKRAVEAAEQIVNAELTAAYSQAVGCFWSKMAVKARREGKFDEALAILDKALELAPRDRRRNGIFPLRAYIKKCSDRVQAALSIIERAINEDRWEDVAFEWEMILEFAPDNREYREQWKEAEHQASLRRQAQKHLRIVSDCINEESPDWIGAIQHVLQAKSLAPNSPNVQFYVDYLVDDVPELFGAYVFTQGVIPLVESQSTVHWLIGLFGDQVVEWLPEDFKKFAAKRIEALQAATRNFEAELSKSAWSGIHTIYGWLGKGDLDNACAASYLLNDMAYRQWDPQGFIDICIISVALQLVESKRYEDAYWLCGLILERRPNFDQVVTYRHDAEYLWQKQRRELALANKDQRYLGHPLVEKVMREAEVALAQRKFGKAALAFERVLEMEPDNVAAIVGWIDSTVTTLMQRFDEAYARDDFAKAMEYLVLAELLDTNQTSLIWARLHLEQCIEISTRKPAAPVKVKTPLGYASLYDSALVALRRGDLDHVIGMLPQFLVLLDPKTCAHYHAYISEVNELALKVALALPKERIDDAFTLLEEVEKRSPRSWDAKQARAKLEKLRGKTTTTEEEPVTA